MRTSLVRPWLALGSIFLLACGGGSNPTGPTSVQLAGRYASTFTIALVNTAEQRQGAGTATVTLQAQDNTGAFTGGYILQDGSSGVVDGTVRADGGIAITAFGDPATTHANAVQYLQNLFPYCDWASAAGSGMSGSVSGTTLTITGTASLTCNYSTTSGVVSLPTTLTLRIDGTRG